METTRVKSEELTLEKLPKAFNQLLYEVSETKRLVQLLLDTKSESETELDGLLTIQQAAILLSLSVPTIYTLVHKAEIPVSKRGKRLYFLRQELLNWIKAGRKKTLAETEAEAKQYLKSKKGLNHGK